MSARSVRERTDGGAGEANDGRSCGFSGDHMGIAKIVIGSLLIAAGALGLAYGSFSYTKETHSANLGPIVLQVQERGTFDVPLALSGGAIVLGVLLLVAFRSK